MKNKKVWKFLGVILSVSMMFTLNGCGSDKKEKSQGGNTSDPLPGICAPGCLTVCNEHQYVTPIIEKMEDFEKLTGIRRVGAFDYTGIELF